MTNYLQTVFSKTDNLFILERCTRIRYGKPNLTSFLMFGRENLYMKVSVLVRQLFQDSQVCSCTVKDHVAIAWDNKTFKCQIDVQCNN